MTARSQPRDGGHTPCLSKRHALGSSLGPARGVLPWGTLLVVISSIVVMAPAASADTGTVPSAVSRADALFTRAVGLRKQGRLDRACPLFERSQSLDPARGTLLNIARCATADHRLLDARHHYRQLIRESKAAGDAERLRIARAELGEVERRVPRLRIVVARGARPPSMAITLDGRTIVDLARDIAVDPGQHSVRATATGYQSWASTVSVAAGGRRAVSIPRLLRVARSSRSPVTTRRMWAIGNAGVSVLAVGLGTYFGLRARSKWRDSEQYCSKDHIVCTPTGHDLVGQAEDAASRANVAFGIGAVAAAAAVYLWISGAPPRPPEPTRTARWRVIPALGISGAGVSVRVRYR